MRTNRKLVSYTIVDGSHVRVFQETDGNYSYMDENCSGYKTVEKAIEDCVYQNYFFVYYKDTPLTD